MAEKHKKSLAQFGSWAFIIGVVLALIVGILGNFLNPNLVALSVSILIVMGLVVGFLNVTENETNTFLMSTVSLVIVTGLGTSVLGSIPLIGPSMSSTLGKVMIFIIPATVVVALKAIYSVAHDE